MAPMCKAPFGGLITVIFFCTFISLTVCQDCNFDEEYHGDWFSMEDGKSITTIVNANKWGKLDCYQRFIHPREQQTEGRNITYLLLNKTADASNACYFCYDVMWRTRNVLQVRKGECLLQRDFVNLDINTTCYGVQIGLPSIDEVIDLFRIAPRTENCISTFEGVYHFTYEIDIGGGGICDNRDSVIQACQDPGSPYVDNQVFRMQFAKCRDVATSSNKQVRYQCMGTWFAMRGNQGYTFAAVADTVEKDNRERFKCLMTLKNQKEAFNKVRWCMSRFADCRNLNSIYNCDIRLVLTRIPPATPYLAPKCNLPRNVTGNWLTQGVQYKSDVTINDTHVYFMTRINEFEYQETYFSCQQSQGTRYLMTKVVVGRCEVDFVCMDVVARHHSIVRYRIGKPFQYTDDEQLTDPNGFRTTTFREACSWMAFTFNRDQIDWMYNVLIMNPPSPVPCPVAGRYSFAQSAQKGNPYEEYQTRIRGVTEKPRVQVDCRQWVTEFKSCSTTMSQIEIDAQYCATLDYRGKPIGEYDEPDNILMCVGFWMEDMKSFLITWDEEDAVSSFRCWVYERMSWTGVVMSRAQNARCMKTQTAYSYNESGVSLHMELSENERLFDDCPQRFESGADPYKKPLTLYILNSSQPVTFSFVLLLASLLITVYAMVKK